MKKTIFTLLMCFLVVATIFIALLFKENSKIASQNVEITQKVLSPVISKTLTPEPVTTFVFAGDMMFDRAVNHYFKKKGLTSIFDNFDKTITSDKDIRFANLEGPISSEAIIDDISPNNLIFNFPPETIEALKSIRINGVSLANNHTLNAGRDGLETTKKLLKSADILYSGEQSIFSTDSVLKYDTKVPVSIIAVNLLESPGQDKVIEKIKEEKTANRFVVVFPHWGNEYALVHAKSQEEAGHSFVDAGADLVVGSHPHVVQDIEIYKDKAIIYSLGNFVFDQTFSKDTQMGLVLTGKIMNDSLELSFVPTKQVGLKPEMQKESEKNALLQRVLPIDGGYESMGDDTIKLKR